MTRQIVAILTASLIAAMSGVDVHAQRAGGPGARRGAPSPTAGVIAGRVYDASTNTPIRRARISATNVDAFLDATTDDEGRFELTGVGPGEWRVIIEKGGYFPWHIGQRRPFDIPPPVTIAPRQRVTADVPLTRGGVIMGRVFDENGEPLADLQVRVYRARMSQGFRRLESVGLGDRTDDTGAYRIYGLPPGDYYVAASLRTAPADSIVETTYAPTYYPGTSDVGEAQRIRVGLGAEATAVFPLLPVRHVRVSGTLLTSSGAATDAFINLVAENGELGIPLGIGAVTRARGAFTLPDVPPGRYTLTASTRGDGPYETASLPVIVGNEDLTGITVTTGRSAGIRGRVVADAGVTRALPDGLEVTAMAARQNGTVISHSTGSSFELDDLADPFYLRITLPQGWMVKSVMVGGVDVTDAKVALPSGQQADARIVITDRGARVSGTVLTKSRAPANARVVIFPADTRKWAFPSRFVRTATIDEKGQFQIAGLPADERYLAVAADYVEDGEHFDPEFLEGIRDRASPFSLAEAETRSLELPMIER
ncbi:MAG TPA: carboxypeptidase regulatory-like domain-containing protein [Vicinamibacterales bacterium]|jgi:carboxypeptidase family protein|nr:carboxypeptidase regulatory-like domain-containing protein [Vicinamibacterales bacterium]